MKTTLIRKTMVGLLPLLLLLPATFAAQIWNTANDFSAVNNPNGVWQYGYESTLGGALILYNVPTTLGTGLNYWTSSNTGADPNPNVSHNPSTSPVAAFDFVSQPNETQFHPGASGQFSVFRWTAPFAGMFSIQADFVGLGNSSTTDLHILVNGSSVFDGAINGKGMTTAFNSTQSFVAGSTVDFAVGFGADGNYFSDTTGIDATIRSSVPEPGSTFLLLLGSVGAVFSLRRMFSRQHARPADLRL
jgi:hypothetical protein